VLLENQTGTSIMRFEFLHTVQTVNHHVKVNGIVGVQLELYNSGNSEEFFELCCYASTERTSEHITYPGLGGPFVPYSV
jgi:hypothetical protein